jgi:hypothetical protein
MKNLKQSLFDKTSTLTRVEMGVCYGGNNSDVEYTDSKYSGGWDIAVNSVIDIVKSSEALDKAPTKMCFSAAQ